MKHRFAVGVLSAAMVGLPAAHAQTEQEFRAPPESAKAMTWWHWMQGNVSREGITADLEAMKRVGIGGALIFHVGQLPIDGDVKFMSEQWWDLMRFAGEEADRLGLKLGVHNCPGWSASGGPWVKVEQSMQKVVWSETAVAGPVQLSAALPRPKAEWNFYRDIAVLAVPEGAEGAEGAAAAPDQIVDLSASMDATGKLTWEVPAGKWGILRMGHTTTGQGCAPAPPGGWGLECDKMDPEAVRAHFEAYPAKLLSNVGKLAGKTLTMIEIDSYEAGDQNWTAKYRQEFSRRRGYDITKWLPVLAGKTIGSDEQTRRFKRDMKLTVAECFADNYYGTMRDLLHQTPGVQSAVEPYGGPFDTSAVAATGDLVMGEYWVNGWYQVASVAAAAHVNGKRIVAAEAFTGSPDKAQWRQDPYALKACGDKAFALGVNQVVLHTTAHQPWMNAKPGMTMGWWGTHFSRTQTWWEQSTAWFSHLARSQYLLQLGLPVADVLMLDHEFEVEGYKTERCDVRVIDRLKVQDGRLVLPDGMSYRALELPGTQEMTPALARKLRQLVKDGATVLGLRPVRSPSMESYPACDTEVESIGKEVWGTGTGEHPFGKGRVISDMRLPEALKLIGQPLDLLLRDGTYGSTILWTHRQTAAADIYFMSNQRHATAEVWTSFRVAGRRPELWHAESGQIEPAPFWRSEDGRTDVLIQLPPEGSIFVVFRTPAAQVDAPVDLTRDGKSIVGRRPLPADLVIRKAVYGILSDPAKQSDVTVALQQRIRDGGRLVAENTLAGDPAPMVVKQMRVTYTVAGAEHTVTVPENGFVEFGTPDEAASTAMLSAADAQLTLLASQPGSYAVIYASGKRSAIRVADVPAAIVPAGPWQVSFPPNAGAPASITLPSLISWPDHPDRGVKYFSGTGTYRAQVNVLADQLRAGIRWQLDLGVVKNIAEVSLNGKAVALLWKPPFAVDVTSALKAGQNDLEVKVTNLWPNRMIGDEQEPDDCRWGDVQYWDGGGDGRIAVGRPLAQVPEWLRTGQPRPSAGRFTMTSWKFYEKDSPLLPSGLIGPVRLVPWRSVRVGGER